MVTVSDIVVWSAGVSARIAEHPCR